MTTSITREAHSQVSLTDGHTWSVFRGTGRGGLTVQALLTLTRSHVECYVLLLVVHKGRKYKPPDLALCKASCRPYFQWAPTNTSRTTLTTVKFCFFWQAWNCIHISLGIWKAKIKAKTSVYMWMLHLLKSRLPNSYKWKFNCEVGNKLFSLFLFRIY